MRKSTMFWGCVIIVIGILLLLDEFVETIEVGLLIWPLILIALGTWVLWGALSGPRTVEDEQIVLPLQGATKARIELAHGAGRLRLNGSAASGDLVTGTFVGGLDHTEHLSGDTLSVKMRVPTGLHVRLPMVWGPTQTLDWTVGLNGSIPLSLECKTGASEARLDLTDLQVTDLRVDTGASSTVIVMPFAAGHTKAEIHAGAASLRIQVPEGVAARITVRSGLGAAMIDRDRFPRTGDVYQSPDYDSATNKAEILVESGVGAVDIR